jgi:hypothetical protein
MDYHQIFRPVSNYGDMKMCGEYDNLFARHLLDRKSWELSGLIRFFYWYDNEDDMINKQEFIRSVTKKNYIENESSKEDNNKVDDKEEEQTDYSPGNDGENGVDTFDGDEQTELEMLRADD